MKIICSQSDLKNHLAFVTRAVPSRAEPPVLGNVLLVADHNTGTVTLTGFDGSLGLRTLFTADIDESGKITLPAKLFSDIVSRLPEMEITLSWGDNDQETGSLVATLSSSSGKFQLNGMDSEEFPELPVVATEEVINLPIPVIIEGLKGCLFAASTEISKQILTGVHLSSSEKDPDLLEFAATDSHRLAVLRVATSSLVVDTSETENFDDLPDFAVTIPARALRELEKMLTDGGETQKTVQMRYDDAQIIFQLGEESSQPARSLNTMRLNGAYPPYERLIPTTFERSLTCDRRQLLNALELVAVLAQKNNVVKFSLNTLLGELTLSVDAQDIGSATQSLPAEIIGDNVDIAFNIKYLMDGLKALPTTEIKMQLNQWNQPVIFSPLGGSHMTYLIMPVQIKN